MNNAIGSSFSSGSLIEKIRASDRNAWDQFVEVYGPLIHNWCLKSGCSAFDAADLVQEVFAKVLGSIHRFQRTPDGSFRGWLWTITRNRIRDFFRQQNDEDLPVGGTDFQMKIGQVVDHIGTSDEGAGHLEIGDEATDDPTSPDQAVQLMQRALHAIRNDFETQTWQAFWKSTIDGEKTRDVAEDLNLSANSVRQAKSRVLRRLRQILSEF